MEKNVCIVHFNTPELTRATVLSVLKHTPDCKITVFDNSTKRPFKKMKGVRVIDNTKGQIFDWQSIVETFPDRVNERWGFASANHMYSIQTLWEYFPDGFVLMDSDVLVKRDISDFFDEDYPASGTAMLQSNKKTNRLRLVPFLCWLNVPMLKANGVRYFDPEKCYTLTPTKENGLNNWWDTGASFLDELIKKNLAFKYIKIWRYIEHYGAGSHGGGDISPGEWLDKYRKLYED